VLRGRESGTGAWCLAGPRGFVLAGEGVLEAGGARGSWSGVPAGCGAGGAVLVFRQGGGVRVCREGGGLVVEHRITSLAAPFQPTRDAPTGS